MGRDSIPGTGRRSQQAGDYAGCKHPGGDGDALADGFAREKFLSHPEPPGYRLSQPCAKRKTGPYVERIKQIIKDDKKIPKKQRHTAKWIFERLQEEGYTGGYTQVKEAVRELRRIKREVFMPLIHRPGEAQVDF